MLGHTKIQPWFFWNEEVAWKYTNQHPTSTSVFFLPLKETKTRKLSGPDMGCSRGRPRGLGLLLCSNRNDLPSDKAGGSESHLDSPSLEKSLLGCKQRGAELGGGAVFAALLTSDPFSWQGGGHSVYLCEGAGGGQAGRKSASPGVQEETPSPPKVPSSRSVS